MSGWIWWAGAMLLAAPAGWATAAVARAYGGALTRPWVVVLILCAAILFAWDGLTVPPMTVRLATLPLAWALLTLALVDILSFRLPNPLTLPLAAAGLAVSALTPGSSVWDHLAGAVGGYGFLALAGWGFERLRGREGIGLGDAKLLAAGGAWLGWRPLPTVLIFACLGAFLWIGVLAVRRGRAVMGERLPFGAPLCLAIWLVWLYGPLGA